MFAITSARRLLGRHGCRVSDEAGAELVGFLEQRVMELAAEASRIARHSGRRTVWREDVRLARRAVRGMVGWS